MSFQAYLDTIKAKTGMSPEDFRVIALQKGLLEPDVKAGAVKAWLKQDYDLGPGHAMALYGTMKSVDRPVLSKAEEIDKHFAGAKANWRPSYGALLRSVQKFGPDVAAKPGNTYISFVRDNKKFAIVIVTAKRMDIGIKLKDTDPTDRFKLAGTWNAMVTHRVGVDDPKQFDAELLDWLHLAYNAA